MGERRERGDGERKGEGRGEEREVLRFCSAKVCRACKRVIEETGGVPYQVPKQVMEEWTSKCDNDEVKWVRKSKKEYKWIETPTFDPFTVCYQALPPPYLFSFLPTPLRKLRYNFKNTFSEIF